MRHPIERFVAPASIVSGSPLKKLLDKHTVALLAEAFWAVYPAFERQSFVRLASAGLDQLELFPRATHIAQALKTCLPGRPSQAARILIDSLGPALTVTKGFGLRPFFYLPHVFFIRIHLLDDFVAGMEANRAITKRFSAEFSIRPFILRYPRPTLALLKKWTADPNPHVRRLVSEGSRPRLPWAERLPPFIADPSPTIALLERLKDDAELYVRRSVANHVGDIAKDHPERAFQLCRRWLDEAEALPAVTARHRRALIRHAIRLPARKGNKDAMRLRRDANK